MKLMISHVVVASDLSVSRCIASALKITNYAEMTAKKIAKIRTGT